MERALKIATATSLMLVCWALSLWSHHDRVCWKNPRLVAFHFQEADGNRLSVPRCSPLSFLKQPEFSDSEKQRIRDTLKVFSETMALAEILKLPGSQRYHLIATTAPDPTLSFRLLKGLLARTVPMSPETQEALSYFYSRILTKPKSSLTSSDRLQDTEHFVRAWVNREDGKILGVVIENFWHSLEPLNRPDFLLKLWRQESLRSKADFGSEIPSRSIEGSLAEISEWVIEMGQKSAMDRSVIENMRLQQKRVIQGLRNQLRVTTTVRVVHEDQGLLNRLQAIFSKQKARVIALEVGRHTFLYPIGLKLLADSETLERGELVLVQCMPPTVRTAFDKTFQSMSFVPACEGFDRDFVAQKVAGYLNPSPQPLSRVDSQKITFSKQSY